MRSREIPSLLWLAAFALILTAALASGQADKQLSAREIFYSPPVEPPPAKKAPPRQAAKAKEKKPAEAKPAPPASISDSVASSGTAAGPMVDVSYTPGETVPLGLRYSILKRESSGSAEVDPDTVFHSGDRIRLRIDVNTAGYLYIVNRGSSGNWKPLFPSPEIADGDNRVQKGKQYEIPPGYVFTFDEQPGREKLFIVFSHQPVSDLEGLIYSLTGGQQKDKEPIRPLIAQVNIQDGLIDRLRTVYSRDLIIEKVDETTPPPPSGPAKEKAVYVANPSRDPDARVVADITLIHN
jgi:hypothetical protein